MESTNTVTVAQTILTQLGRRAWHMLGANTPVVNETSVTFKIGKNSKQVSHIKITLNANDLYDMTFYRIRGVQCTILAQDEHVFVEDMHHTIEARTGLYTSL